MLKNVETAFRSTDLAPGVTYQPVREVMARGPNFVYAKEFILSNHGASTWERILADMPIEARDIWMELLLVTDSYPFSAFKEMLSSLSRTVGERPEAETAEMYEFIAERSLNTVYKFFFRLADPSFVLKRYPVLWQRFFKTGEVRVPRARKGTARLEFDLPAVFLDWLRPACFGYSKKAIEMAGGSNLELEESAQEELSRGIWRTTYDLRWRERSFAGGS